MANFQKRLLTNWQKVKFANNIKLLCTMCFGRIPIRLTTTTLLSTTDYSTDSLDVFKIPFGTLIVQKALQAAEGRVSVISEADVVNISTEKSSRCHNKLLYSNFLLAYFYSTIALFD